MYSSHNQSETEWMKVLKSFIFTKKKRSWNKTVSRILNPEIRNTILWNWIICIYQNDDVEWRKEKKEAEQKLNPDCMLDE